VSWMADSQLSASWRVAGSWLADSCLEATAGLNLKGFPVTSIESHTLHSVPFSSPVRCGGYVLPRRQLCLHEYMSILDDACFYKEALTS